MKNIIHSPTNNHRSAFYINLFNATRSQHVPHKTKTQGKGEITSLRLNKGEMGFFVGYPIPPSIVDSGQMLSSATPSSRFYWRSIILRVGLIKWVSILRLASEMNFVYSKRGFHKINWKSFYKMLLTLIL